MHHMWVNARLWPTVRVARVLGCFPRLTRPGPDCAGGRCFGAVGAVVGVISTPPFHCVRVWAVDCAPGEQGCEGRDDGV